METEQEITGDWFVTASGGRFWPTAPRIEDVNIQDIAHALSNLCRFGGHCREFYSVAQHSVMVSMLVPDPHKLCGLLHDATEAYVGDMVRPLKRALPSYQSIEAGVWEVVARKFDLPLELPAEVKHADNVILATERRDIVKNTPYLWKIDEMGYKPCGIYIKPLEPRAAAYQFLMRYEQLRHGRDC